MLDYVWLIPALPLAGFLVLLVLGRRLGEPLAGWFATAMVAASFVVTVLVFFALLDRPGEQRSVVDVLFTWLPVGALRVDASLLADPLSITMALFITGIGSLIHLYAIGYMHGDETFSKFFLFMNLFVFSMLVLVLGGNMLLTFLGWEGVGVCSYFLIAFWHTRNSAAVAGKKAFITNRVGDVGFMLAIFFTFQAVGSIDYSVLNESAKGLSTTTATVIALLLFVGACGKSAQLPLFVWLPDAMEGPTPVSALIHAATMVTAGVYLLTRVGPVLYEVPDVGTVIAIVGAATALFAATVAIAQNDIKKVLAYSTISQLGYMFLAVGSGAYVAAVFHMLTHAFFKALLFLGSGSVIHGMRDEQDMRRMGALRVLLPVTSATFIIGWLAITGVPPFSGFWSKDDILLYAYDKSPALWAVGLVTALLTAYYMTRQVVMVFFGEARWDDARDKHLAEVAAEHDDAALLAAEPPAADPVPADDHGHGVKPHESPWVMLVPLVVLAFLAVVGAVLNLPFDKLHFLQDWLEPVVGEAERKLAVGTKDIKWILAGVAAATSVVGIALAWLVYERKKLPAVEPSLFANAWYVDTAYAAAVDGPGRTAFQAVADGDAGLVDGAVVGTAGGVNRVAGGLRRYQNGFVRSYALGIGLGAVALLAWFVSRGLF